MLGGGAGRARTGDPLLAKQMLSQLSYSPVTRYASIRQKNDRQRNRQLVRSTGKFKIWVQICGSKANVDEVY